MIREKTEANSLYLRNQLTTSSNLFFFKGNATFTFISSSSHTFFCSGCGAEGKYLYPPRAHGHQKGWSGFILWAGASEAGQSPNSTHWDNQMTSLMTEGLCEPASTQKLTLVFGFSQLTARIQRSDWFGGQKVDQWGPICEQTTVWTERFTKCS